MIGKQNERGHSEILGIYYGIILKSKGTGKVHLGTGNEGTRGVEVELCSFFNLGTRWGSVTNVNPRPLYPWEKDPVLIS